MSHTWVIVANSTTARIFEAVNNTDLLEVEQFAHPEGRLHPRDLVSDKPGRSFESAAVTRHAIEPRSDPQKMEFSIFAKDLTDHLEVAQREGKFKKLYIAAGPQFLGLLRQMISPSIAAILAGEVDKDMTHMTSAEIRKHLPFVI